MCARPQFQHKTQQTQADRPLPGVDRQDVIKYRARDRIMRRAFVSMRSSRLVSDAAWVCSTLSSDREIRASTPVSPPLVVRSAICVAAAGSSRE